jgi:multidrug efflux system outer membrane protein
MNHNPASLELRLQERAMTNLKKFAVILLLLFACACKLGPNYTRPATTVPAEYRGLPPGPQPTGEQFGDMKWWAVFQDDALQNLIKAALKNNYDLRIAATRILQAQANLGITRANQYPQLNGTGAIVNERNNFYPSAPTFGILGLQLSYIVDFWGQFRRATEAAQAQLLGTEYGQNVVRTTLVASVADNYFLLRAYDSQLTYANDTVAVDREILRLNEIRFKGGEAAIMEVYQAQVLLQAAQAQAIDLQRLIEQTENNISVLLGENPGPIIRGLDVVAQRLLPEVPAGLPSALLERRPDVRVAEENLVAANANVGVAKANFFPQFTLTSSFGSMSTALSAFTAGPGTFWSAGLQAAQPLFQGGRIRSQYRLAWAQRDEAELTYKKTVNQAFADVSNSLVGYAQARQYRMKLEEQTNTYSAAARLANVRFQGGVTSFLEVQYNEQQYFDSQLALSQAWYSELANYVALYQALGGGWQQ